MPDYYSPLKALQETYHQFSPGNVSSMITVDTYKPGGVLPRSLETNRFYPRTSTYGQPNNSPAHKTNMIYDTLESVQPGRNVRLPSSFHFPTQSDVRSGLIRTNGNGEHYTNLRDAFTDNLLLGNRTVYRDIHTAKLLQDDIANRRRAAAKAHWGSLGNPYASTKGLTHPIVMGPLTGADRITDANRDFYTTGNVPIKYNTRTSRFSWLPPFVSHDDDPASYAVMPSYGETPHIGLNSSKVDKDVAETDRAVGLERMVNDEPVNVPEGDNRAPDVGTLRHELAHLMTDTTAGSRDAVDEVYNTNRERGTYANSASDEALRAHRFMKDVYTRHLMNQGLKPEEVVDKVQDPEAFLEFMNSVYNSGEGGGFSLPEGSVPAGLEVEAYRAANGLRPIVAELLGNDSVKAYNSWARSDEELMNRYYPHIVPAVPEKENPNAIKHPRLNIVPRRRSLFRSLHPQVNNNRRGHTANGHIV